MKILPGTILLAWAVIFAGCEGGPPELTPESGSEDRLAYFYAVDQDLKTWQAQKDAGAHGQAEQTKNKILAAWELNEAYFVEGLASRNPGEAGIAAAVVGLAGDRAYEANLYGLLDSKNSTVVANALEGLANLGTSVDPNVLSDHLSAHDPAVRIGALRLLSQSVATDEAMALVATRLGDPASDVRSEAAVILGRSGDPSYVTPLVQALAQESESEARLVLAQALADLKGREAGLAILGAAKSEPDRVRQRSLLASLASATGAQFGRDLAAWEHWIETEGSVDWVQTTEPLPLAHVRSPEPDLGSVPALPTPKLPPARDIVTVTVPEPVPPTVTPVEVPEEPVLPATPPLAKKEPTPQPEPEPMEPLPPIATQPPAVSPEADTLSLFFVLENGNPNDRVAAHQELAGRGRPVLTEISRRLPNAEEVFALELIRLTESLALPEALRTLRMAYRRPNKLIRLAALRAAWNVSGPDGLDLYNQAVEDERWLAVQRSGAEKSLRSGSTLGMDVLINALADEDVFVREHAVTVLREVTGQSFGFDPKASEQDRRRAHFDWGSWWALNRDSSPTRK